MSLEAIVWVMEKSPAKGSDRLVLLAVANYADPDGKGAWPSIPTICRLSNLTRNTVEAALARLHETGQLVKAGVKKRNCPVRHIIMDATYPKPTYPKPQGSSGRNLPQTMGDDPVEELQDLEVEANASTSGKSRINIIWDALIEVTGYTPSTRSECKDFGTTVSELRSVIPNDATYDQIRAAMVARRRAFARAFEGATFTHRVLRGKWGELGELASPGRTAKAVNSGIPDLMPAADYIEWRRTATPEQNIAYQGRYGVSDLGEVEGF